MHHVEVFGWAANARLASMVARALAPTGAMFTFLALWTGALWGKPTWGAWWVWDARLTSELILLFLYLGYMALVESIDDVRRALPTHRGVTHLTPGEWVKASTGLAAAIEDGTVAHDGDDVLTAALAAAVSKPMGESWAMSHKSRPEAVAACAALRGLASLPRRAPAPFIYLAQESA